MTHFNFPLFFFEKFSKKFFLIFCLIFYWIWEIFHQSIKLIFSLSFLLGLGGFSSTSKADCLLYQPLTTYLMPTKTSYYLCIEQSLCLRKKSIAILWYMIKNLLFYFIRNCYHIYYLINASFFIIKLLLNT